MVGIEIPVLHQREFFEQLHQNPSFDQLNILLTRSGTGMYILAQVLAQL
jgi:hypothetical protein